MSSIHIARHCAPLPARRSTLAPKPSRAIRKSGGQLPEHQLLHLGWAVITLDPTQTESYEYVYNWWRIKFEEMEDNRQHEFDIRAAGSVSLRD